MSVWGPGHRGDCQRATASSTCQISANDMMSRHVIVVTPTSHPFGAGCLSPLASFRRIRDSILAPSVAVALMYVLLRVGTLSYT